MYDSIINLSNIDKEKIKTFYVETRDDETIFHIELKHSQMDCPFCGGSTCSHGHTKPKIINHPVLTARNSYIIFKSNRHICNECGKTFVESNPFTYDSFKNSIFCLNNVMKQLSNLNYTYKMIGNLNNISTTQVQRYMDSYVNIPRIHLPVSIGIDEIHSKMAKRKNSSYLCIMVDNEHRCLFEMLPSRSKTELNRYFDKISKEEKATVRFVTIDMWEPYKDVALRQFPNCVIAVDPFHVVKHLMDAFTRIRLNIMYQVEYGSDAYYLLKTWKDLIETDVDLDNEPVYNKRFKKKLNKRQLRDMILDISENLALGYELKEMYRRFNKEATFKNCEAWFDYLVEAFEQSGLSEYNDFISMIKNWKVEILNSFLRPFDDRKLSNALAENTNSKLRSYIAISNGISNFTRFRKRCIFALNPKVFYAITDKLRTDKREGKKRKTK